jgi:maltose alpha-D-glucosyltransferase/alpha-amylase
MLHENSDRLGEPAKGLAQRLRNHREAICLYIEGLKSSNFTGSKIRVHGDFHLGQVLIAKDDAYILDFEGEPRQSLEQRRVKAPPARDVAGFLRSIDYATSAAIDRAPNITAEERSSLGPRIRSWGARLSGAFWESYRETLARMDIWPADEAKAQELLNLFQLEKAFYEIEYEVTNRPSWAHIPLEGTLRILAERGVLS